MVRAAEQTARIHTWLTRQLGQADWFNGNGLLGRPRGRAFVNGSAGFGNAPDEGSALGRWLARVNARPSVAQTAKEARDSIAAMAQVANVLEQGLFKREYRDHRLEWMMKTGGVEIVLDGLKKDNIRFSHDFK